MRFVLVAALLAGCHSSDTTAPAPAATGSADRSIQVPADVLVAAHVKVEPAHTERLAGVIEVVGEIAVDPDRVASIASPIAGRLESVKLELGAAVNKGDVVAVVLAPELGHARADSVAKRAQASAARANADRQADLRAHGIASEKDTAAATAQADTLDAEARAADGLLSALGTGRDVDVASSRLTLRAPRAGRVIRRDANLGQPVEPMHVLGTIADLSEVWFQARVFERELARARIGTSVEIRLDAYPDQSLTGAISYIDAQLDPSTRSAIARVVLPNPDGALRLGMFGRARLAADSTAPEVVVVPRAAVTDLDGRATVFVRTNDTTFQRREVVLGTQAGDRIAISSGLHVGEPVVTDGAFTLRSIVLRGTLEDD